MNGAAGQNRVLGMTLVWLCLIWVFLSVTVATLPLRMQYIPGAILLVAGPVLIGFEVGVVFSLLGLAAFVSMFRNPLRFVLAKLRGKEFHVPGDEKHPEVPR